MAPNDDGANATSTALDKDEVERVLAGSYYRAAPRERSKTPVGSGEKPSHYKVICISMYTHDLEELDKMVGCLKARGFTKASRSALIRFALSEVDLAKVPRGL